MSVDGSYSPHTSDVYPYKEIAYVKTALLSIDNYSLSKVDRFSPHPFELRDILHDSAVVDATLFPLKNVALPGMNTYDSIRKIIFDSMARPRLERQPLETLKWLAYMKWKGTGRVLPIFQCPNCLDNIATLPYDAEKGNCPGCGGLLYVTDMLGFHQAMAEDSAPEAVVSDYMTIHETMLLFSAIRYFWETRKDVLEHCLFVRDGPLSIRAQYSKLVEPIRQFLAYARDQGVTIHIVSQEKTGRFCDHLGLIEKSMPPGTLFIPDNKYIKSEIQHRPNTGAPYGKDTNYGAKVFLKIDDYRSMVLNVPTGGFVENPEYEDLIGINRILATLPTILSYRYEGGLLPIELANGVASLSTYPSAKILKVFAQAVLAP